MLAAVLVAPILLSMAAFWVFDHAKRNDSLFLLANLVGGTAEKILHGAGLTACTTAQGTVSHPLPICFHAGRMPVPTLVVALGILVFGNHYLPVGCFKLILLLLPVEAAIYLVGRRLPADRVRKFLICLLLLVPFGITAFLADIVNMQVEEGYSYAFIALAVAMLFFAPGLDPASVDPVARPILDGQQPRDFRGALARVLLFGFLVDAIYLSKSSMAPAALLLTIAYCVRERRLVLRLLLLLMFATALMGWAIHQHHASGRYALGTSLDGVNLHKGNNEAFLSRYPPAVGQNLDQFDLELNDGRLFSDEWTYNDFHTRAAVAFIETHPVQTIEADERKLSVVFFSIAKLGSTEDHGLLLYIETAGMIVFRIVLWTAIGCAIYSVFRPARQGSNADSIWRYQTWRSGKLRSATWCGTVYLCFLAAAILPYILGFVYTRHISVLIYPSVLMCCAMLLGEPASPELDPLVVRLRATSG